VKLFLQAFVFGVQLQGPLPLGPGLPGLSPGLVDISQVIEQHRIVLDDAAGFFLRSLGLIVATQLEISPGDAVDEIPVVGLEPSCFLDELHRLVQVNALVREKVADVVIG
jgi:hypothetical protein